MANYGTLILLLYYYPLWQGEIWNEEALGGFYHDGRLLCYLGPRVPTSKFSPARLVDSDLFVRTTVALGRAENLASGRLCVPVGRLPGPLVQYTGSSTAKYYCRCRC